MGRGPREDDMVGRHGGPQTSARPPITHSSRSSASILPPAPGSLRPSQEEELHGGIAKSTISFGQSPFSVKYKTSKPQNKTNKKRTVETQYSRVN